MRLIGAFGLFAMLSTMASPGEAYLQNLQLESALRRSDPRVLSLLPAKGYKDGAAGFFRDYGLYVVPDTERAWCNDKVLGVLQRGCYVEFHFQLRGLKPIGSDGTPCGFLGRWHLAPGSKAYAPTRGAYYSIAIAKGNHDEVVLAFQERPLPRDFKRLRQTTECDSAFPRTTGQSASRQ